MRERLLRQARRRALRSPRRRREQGFPGDKGAAPMRRSLERRHLPRVARAPTLTEPNSSWCELLAPSPVRIDGDAVLCIALRGSLRTQSFALNKPAVMAVAFRVVAVTAWLTCIEARKSVRVSLSSFHLEW